MVRSGVFAAVLWLAGALAVKVKVVMHSEQDDSRPEEEDWERRAPALLPFVSGTTEATTRPSLHPNDMLFPLIYRQSHINSMFKFGDNWYTWSSDRRADGSRALTYYICYEEPKHCDDVGWERTENIPKCAFEIDSVLAEDRACLNAFGVEPHPSSPGSGPSSDSAVCDGADLMKVSDLVRSCGPRIRSLWRFVRVGRRPPAAAKPADVNSLLCEDEEECFLTVEYRIHHDRITFSLHEPTRGQTFKSILKRERTAATAATAPPATERAHRARARGSASAHRARSDPLRKFRSRSKTDPVEGKGIVKERTDSGYETRRTIKNKIKVIDEDVSDDVSSDN